MPEWRWNEAARRYELTIGGQVFRAIVAPGGSTAGLDMSVRVEPLEAEIAPLLDKPDGPAMVGRYLTGATQEELTVAQQNQGQQPTGQGQTAGLGLSVEQRRQQNNLTQGVVGQLKSQAQLDQAEHNLRSEMMQAGVSPEDFFRAYPAPTPATGGETSQYGASVTPSPDMADQLQRQTGLTFDLANQERANRLQQIANAWEGRKQGIANLTARQGLDRSIAAGERNLALAQQQAMRDPTASRQQVMTTDASGNIQYVPAGAAGAVGELDDLRRQRDLWEQRYDPLGYQERKRQELTAMRARDPRSVPDHVAAAAGLPGFAAGGTFWDSTSSSVPYSGTHEGTAGGPPNTESEGMLGQIQQNDLQRQARQQQQGQRQQQLGLEGQATAYAHQQALADLDRQAQEMEQAHTNWRAEFDQASQGLAQEEQQALAEIAQQVEIARARQMAENPYAAAVGMGQLPPAPVVMAR